MDDAALGAGLHDLIAEVHALRNALLAAETQWSTEIEAAHPLHRESARNLVHYVELRSHDVRALQHHLAPLGISSLGRSESHVMATIDSVLGLLCRLAEAGAPDRAARLGFEEGVAALERNTAALLGEAPPARTTRIMVTMPGDATSPEIAELARLGMDVARINCAHDDEAHWSSLVAAVRSTGTLDGRACRVAMDLGGPKLRTGPLQPGPRVIRVAPERDRLGHVASAGLVWITADGTAAPEFGGRTPVVVPMDDHEWVARRVLDDRLAFDDARGAKRSWRVVQVGSGGFVAAARATTYVQPGLKVTCRSGRGDDLAAIGELPALDVAHRIGRGDSIVLTRSLEPTVATGVGEEHVIGCTLPEAFVAAAPQQRVWLDDGKIGGLIDEVDDDRIRLTVTNVRPGGANLRAGKGINLPDSELPLAALTDKDIEDLSFVARHADMVNLSFVRSAEDVLQLQAELARLEADHLGIVLKIENANAFENLPALLLAVLRSEAVGVMIARGDLAVEVGFERLAEVQEEIMWACEAAHIPVIWATQVLDNLARTGHASRAEVTDAAMAVRAECVMLNKGPHIADAITVLESILIRMQSHHHKKRSLLRRLQAWDGLRA